MGRVLLPELATPRATPAFHRECWSLVCDPAADRVAIAAPRAHAKSTAITFTTSLASSLFRHDPYTVIVSRTYALATEFIRTLKTSLLTNERLRRAFGVKGLTKDTENDFICQMDDGYEFRMEALGFGGSVRGLNWNTQRPTRIVLDDVEDDELVLSRERRDKAMDWLLQALLPAMDPVRNRAVAVGTFMHIDSLLKNLVDDPEWRSLVYEAHNDDFSTILWPEMYTRERLLKIRKGYEAQNRLDRYNMEYRNRVVDTSSGFFRKAEFLPMEDHHYKPDFKSMLSWWASGDFAWSVKEKSDFTVLPICGVDYDNNIYVYHIERARMDGGEVVKKMFELQEEFNPGMWFNERGAIHNSLLAAIEMQQRRSGVFLNIKGMPAHKEKQIRARPFQARMRAGSVYWNTRADWYPEVMQELLEFPRGKHDDCVDALAHMATGLAEEVMPASPDEIEMARYDEMAREAQTFEGGRNQRTGY